MGLGEETTQSEAATCQTKSRAADFSKVRVSELFNLLERTVEHEVNGIRIYVYNADGTALTIFQGREKTRKSSNGEL